MQVIATILTAKMATKLNMREQIQATTESVEMLLHVGSTIAPTNGRIVQKIGVINPTAMMAIELHLKLQILLLKLPTCISDQKGKSRALKVKDLPMALQWSDLKSVAKLMANPYAAVIHT